DITPSQIDLKVVGVFNAAAIRHNNETILFLRVAEGPIIREADAAVGLYFDHTDHTVKRKSFNKNDPDIDCRDPRIIKTRKGIFLTSLSHIRKAWSHDGLTFTVDTKPTLLPMNEYETYGIEDPRVTYVDGLYALNYTGVSSHGIATMLATSRDLLVFKRHGIMFVPDNRDVVIFPQKIDGHYMALHRPCTAAFGPPSIWIARSKDLLQWGGHRCLIRPSHELWEARKIGGGAVPIKTNKGWLVIYHGVGYDDVYSLGAVLLDGRDPTIIKGRLHEPILQPLESYECEGFFGNTVFTCGAVVADDGAVNVYYGAADETLCVATIEINELLKKF
ncbi:MAG: glycoside hydrolase family 130 protein, partial [Candidatus Omnitrophica bacterium]|nr:glycoside hydrolase family 130 protein [Candidatus Omnitrophota bacterium]